MKTSEIFDALLSNLKVGDTAATVAARRNKITKVLNKDFRSKDGCTDHKAHGGLLRPAHRHQGRVRS